MPIKVACQCGASFAAKDELAGKAVRCPTCKQPLKIPGATVAAAPVAQGRPAAGRAPAAAVPTSNLSDLFDEAGINVKAGPTCPKCNAELKANAVLCVACGFDLQSGENRVGVKIRDLSRDGHGEAADSLLSRAERQIAIDKEEDKKNLTHGAPAYVYIFGLGIIVAFTAMMFTLPKGLAFHYSGICLLVFAALLNSYYSLRFWIAAFQESVSQGFLQFVPFYSLYYLITRWARVGTWFMRSLQLIPLLLLGAGMVGLGMLLGYEYAEKQEAADLMRQPPALVADQDSGSPSVHRS